MATDWVEKARECFDTHSVYRWDGDPMVVRVIGKIAALAAEAFAAGQMQANHVCHDEGFDTSCGCHAKGHAAGVAEAAARVRAWPTQNDAEGNLVTTIAAAIRASQE